MKRKLFWRLALAVFCLFLIGPGKVFALPDLIVLSVNAPSSAAQGGQISVTVTFKNQGDSLTLGSYVRTRLIVSPDTQINLADVNYTEQDIPNTNLEAGESAAVTFNYTLPSSLVGSFYVGAYVDAATYHPESNENNNANYDSTPMYIGLPSTPTGLSLSAIANGLRISWNNVAGAEQYKIYWGNDSSVGESNYAGILTTGSTPYDHSGLVDGATYYYRVKACNLAGCSNLSSYVSKQYQAAGGVPAIPTGLTLTSITGGLRITWNNVTGATSYKAYWGNDSSVSESNYAGILTTGSTPYDHTGLVNASYYYYRIMACNASGCSALSSYVSKQYLAYKVNLQSPANGSTLATDWSTENKIFFDWGDVAGAVRYEIIVDNNSGLGSPEIHEPGIHAQSLTQSRYEVTNWLPNNVYYWKVIAHFSNGTTEESERWSFTYVMAEEPKPVWVPLYRFYKGGETTRDHFYTTSPTQGTDALSKGYKYERVECYVSDRRYPASIPLMRLYKPSINTHFYTTNESEKDLKIISGYQYEGIQAFLFSSGSNGAVPLHRLKQPKSSDFHYFLCARETEYKQVLATIGWNFQDDGAAGYVYLTGTREAEAQDKPQGNYGGVDMATRAFRKTHADSDLALNGLGPGMVFRHYYNSFNLLRVPMGPGWSHSFYSYVMEVSDYTSETAPPKMAIVKWGDGTETYFTYDTSKAKYIPQPGSYMTLTRISDGVNYGYDVKTKERTTFKYRRMSVSTTSPIPSIYLLNVEDRNGNKLSLSWQASHGQLMWVADPFDRRFTFEYGNSNYPLLVTKVTDSALNRSVSFNYDADGRLFFYTDARGKTTQYQYNELDLVIKITRPEGNTYEITYNADGTVKNLKNGTSAQSSISPLADDPITGAKRVQVTTPTGESLEFHDVNYSLTKLIDGYLQPTEFVYGDAARSPGLPTEVKDRRGNITKYSYDDRGNVLRITNPLNEFRDFSYNAEKDLMTGFSDFYLLGNLVNWTNLTYDAKGNLMDQVNAEGENSHFTYDPLGLMTSSRDGNLKITHYEYDSHGMVKKITDPENNVTQFEYDVAGRLLWQKDATGKYSWYTYDANSNLTQVRNHSQFPVTIDFDGNNNIKRLCWTKQGVTSETSYVYDGSDRLISVKNPLNLLTQYGYYPDDALESETNPENETVQYSYDKNGLLQSLQYPDFTSGVTRYENGMLKWISSPMGLTQYQYDQADRISQITDPFGKTVKYAYDDAGRLSTLTYPDMKAVSYLYDRAGRLKEVKDWNDARTSYVYDSAGNLKEIQRANGAKAIYTYDGASRLKSITEQKADGTKICSYSFDLDWVGNIRSIEAEDPISGPIPPKEISYAYDKANRLLSAGSVTFSYDNNGNRATSSEAGGTTYGWDFENMLIQIQATTPAKTVQYEYDGLTNRISKIEGAFETRYVLDLSGDMSKVLCETDASGNITAYYIYGLGLVSRIGADGSVRYYHYNHRGDTVALTDHLGNVTDKYAYDEYGPLLASSGSTQNRFKFVGRFGVMDEGDGLYFMRARYYDAKVGRFLTEDPLGFEGGDWNLFEYADMNPITYTDPEGTFPIAINPMNAVVMSAVELPFIVYDATQQTYYTWKQVNSYLKGEYRYSLVYGELAGQSSQKVMAHFMSIAFSAFEAKIRGSKRATKVLGKTGALKLLDMRTQKGIMVKKVWAVGERKLKNKIEEELLRLILR